MEIDNANDRNIEELTNDELFDLFEKIGNHINYLKSNILIEEEDNNEDVKI